MQTLLKPTTLPEQQQEEEFNRFEEATEEVIDAIKAEKLPFLDGLDLVRQEPDVIFIPDVEDVFEFLVW